VRDEGQLHLLCIHPLVGGESPQTLEAVKQAVFGSIDATLIRHRVGASQFGEAESLLFEDGAYQQGKVSLLGRRKKRRCYVDGGFDAVVPWHL
jgi:hypothetical protein